MMNLSEEGELTQDVKDHLEKIVCTMYCPKGVYIDNISNLRWKQLAESNKLSLTPGALEENMKRRVRLQSRVWCQATIMNQKPFDPLKYGYYSKDGGNMLPVTTTVLPAPQEIIELVKCQYKTFCFTNRCSCRYNKLPCTELCLCDTECDNVEEL